MDVITYICCRVKIVCFVMLEENPYELKVKKWRKRRRVIAISDSPIDIINKNTGEVTTAQTFSGNDRFRDTTDFVKIYEPRLLMGLSKAGSNILMYIFSRMNFSGYVEFTYEQCKKDTGYRTNKSVYDAIVELARKDIIRPKEEGGYWINPNIAYRGQRTGFEVREEG